jgi:uncharacterized membrane protein
MATGFTLSKARFEAFSDGVFAIAITLLVLEFHLPNFQTTPSAAEQFHALVNIWPQYIVYVASFATIGIMWVNHHSLLRYIEKITYGIIMANLLLLLFISFLPFPTEVLAKFGVSSTSIVYYGIVLSLIAVGYNVLLWQVKASHPSIPRRPAIWGVVGLTAYPVATVIAYFAPIEGVVAFALLMVFYLLPASVASVSFKPE